MSSAKKLLAAATLFACSPAFAAQLLTFDFSTLTTGQLSYTLTQSGITLTINSPTCDGTAQAFLVNDTPGTGLALESIAGATGCAAGTTLTPNQFNMTFNQNVEFVSYVSTVWDGGNYELVIGGSTASTSSVGASASANFVGQPIALASGAAARLQMDETAATTSGKLKSITVNCPSCNVTTVSAPILTIEKHPATFATEVK